MKENKAQLMGLVIAAVAIMFVALTNNVGGFAFIIIFFIAYVAFINFYQAAIRQKDITLDTYKRKVQQEEEVQGAYYDSRLKMIRKVVKRKNGEE